jgi:hypothetical protein
MDRFTMAIVVGVLALVVAGVGAAAIVRGRETPPDLSTPRGVTLAYALAEQRGDGQTAWDLLAPSLQARGDHDRFLARVGNQGGPREYLTIEDEQIQIDAATVVLARTYPGSVGLFGGGSSTNRSTVRLARDTAGWRITVPPDEYNVFLNPPNSPRP